ncbi:protein of unknown function [Azospirillum lipoferum 4B]|uniref:Uncharacterized protein n=1 Tax=Azospirillum lipoferum (strain 4B) TaxID=862719 RepID=G7Z2W1_AZOL4|nr:protein of unknown function [Azospirillum lipoferum 4B]
MQSYETLAPLPGDCKNAYRRIQAARLGEEGAALARVLETAAPHQWGWSGAEAMQHAMTHRFSEAPAARPPRFHPSVVRCRALESASAPTVRTRRPSATLRPLSNAEPGHV